jgi:hypothetical protein
MAMRVPPDLLSRIKLMLAVQSRLQKYSGFRLAQITAISAVVPTL